MSRRGSAKPTGIQMFPFLAVLICTMGALVVLLHAFARQGQVEAMKTAKAKASQQKAEDELDADFFRWRIGHLRDSRDKTRAQLNAERLKLSHVEDHERRLMKKLDALKQEAAGLDRAGEAASGEAEEVAAKLADTLEELDEARAAIAEARRNNKFKEVKYSVVPYLGPNATDRRPIYIECRSDAIVLQPEGIELTRHDFLAFFGPGNPLASALRAEREYFARLAPEGTLSGEPYPLLLVRPDGITAYYTARAALDSWGSDFGYELVGADWKLAFPDRDDRLAELLERVVVEARIRQREYVRNSPLVARQRSRPVYHADSRGGVSKIRGTGNGPEGSGMGDWDDYDESMADAPGVGRRGGGGWSDSGNGGSGHSKDLADAPGDGFGGRNESGGPGDERAGEPFGGGGFAEGQNGELVDPYAEPDALRPHRQGDPYAQGSGGGANRDQLAQSDPPGVDSLLGRPGAGEQYRSDYEGPRNASPGTGGPESGTAASQQQGRPGAKAPNDKQAKASQSAGGEGCPIDGTETESPVPQVGGGASMPKHLQAPPSPHVPKGSHKKPRSMASTRGEDWGLPGSKLNAIAASRPILVRCYPDRLVVMPESRGQAPREVKLGPHTADSMDELVSSVWDTMQVWGKAGRGMYWRPTLAVDIAPGAETRFEEVKALLADSGLDVEQRRPPARPAVQQRSRR